MQNSTKNIYTKEIREKEEEKLWFHTIILLSKNTSLSLNDRKELEKLGIETQRNIFINSTFSNELIEDPAKAESHWSSSIVLEENTLKFTSEEVEIETLCVLFQTCPSPTAVIDYIFELKHVKLLMKYFRLYFYQRLENEVCIYLPKQLSEQYISTLVDDFLQEKAVKDYFPQGAMTQSNHKNGVQRNTEMELSKKVVRDIEDNFHQPNSTVFDSVLYYCFIKDAAPKEILKRIFRTSGYVREENEKCICLSPDFTKKMIERLDIDILIHKTLSDTSIHSIVNEQLHVPEEVMTWDFAARKRFVENMKKNSTVKIYRSRLMIVGCAGAGKTTLLKRLLNRDITEFPTTKSTEALEIHESLFTISDETNEMIALSGDNSYKKEKTLSITDFAGQSAYYACHQVYLSGRALYILVIDLSKKPTDPVSPKKTFSREALFDNWEYKDYYKFWMESIRTYCNTTSPVILVGTHKDFINKHTEDNAEKKKDRFSSFLSQLPDDCQLQQHLHIKNYFELGKPEESRDEMDRLEKCIVKMIQKQPTWGEIVPKLWEEFDQKLHSLKRRRLITFSELRKSCNWEFSSRKKDILDMLRFFHDCGKILFFNEKYLSEMVILDVQWFVDAFKEILTDEDHRTGVLPEEWTSFNETGMLDYKHLTTIWTELGLHEMIKFKDEVPLYMQRLGLFAVGKEKLYAPSVNKHELSDKDFQRIKNTNHTSILKFRFPKFLPHFYFYRLVVACLDEWETQKDGKIPLLFKNAAFLKYTDNKHRIVLGVSSTQIHLQIYTCNLQTLQEDVILKIRSKIESFLEQLTRTFHKPVEYNTGFTCKSTNITGECKDALFIPESEAVKEYYLADQSGCPHHDRNVHDIYWKEMLKYWRKRTDLQDSCCQRLFSRRRSRAQKNSYAEWNKKDTDVESGEASVKLIQSDETSS